MKNNIQNYLGKGDDFMTFTTKNIVCHFEYFLKIQKMREQTAVLHDY